MGKPYANPITVEGAGEVLHSLTAKLHQALAKTEGVTSLELVVDGPDCAIWGFEYDGIPTSLSWNVTP